jgi:hypothetical protein
MQAATKRILNQYLEPNFTNVVMHSVRDGVRTQISTYGSVRGANLVCEYLIVLNNWSQLSDIKT